MGIKPTHASAPGPGSVPEIVLDVRGGTDAHAVQFYRDEAFLADTVASFITAGLQQDEAAVVIASAEHLQAFQRALAARQVAVAEEVRRGTLVLCDASEMLARFMVDGAVDAERFAAAVQPMLEQARLASGTRRVRAYGDMVDVLWRDGNSDAMLRLEEAWGQLLHKQGVPLLCAYSLAGFQKVEHGAVVEQICQRHAHVAHSEDHQGLDDAAVRRRLVELEQRAALLEAEIERRTQAEAESTQLFRLTEAVNRASALEQVYEPALDAVQAVLGADRASVLLFDDDGVMRFKAWRGLSDHYRAAVEGHSPWARGTPDPAPILVDDVDLDDAWAAYRPLFQSEGIRALGFVPLLSQGRLLGKFMLYCRQPRRLTRREVELAQTVAAQIAQAVARAALFTAERQARADAERNAERTRQLQRVTSHLSETVLPEQVAGVFIDECRAAALARTSAVWVLDEASATLQMLKSDGYPPEVLPSVVSLPLDAAIPLAEAARSGEPCWIDSPHDYQARYPASATRTRGAWGAAHSVACLPLRVDGRTLGAVALAFPDDRRLDAELKAFLVALSQQCAQALERARLFDSERQARQAREEILAVVSHDLRNPLSSIVMSAAAVAGMDVGEKSVRLRTHTERIQRATQRMTRLIDDLVDFASIQGGRLAITPARHGPEDLVAQAVEMFDALAAEREILLETRTAPDLPRVHCDFDRAVQALANLVSNAIKVTPAGGRVIIGAEPHDGQVAVFVEDVGPGIAAEELPRLFERYWRSKRVGYRGTGLGLAITKGIVDAHGGRVWAHSVVGEGSRFCFALPVA